MAPCGRAAVGARGHVAVGLSVIIHAVSLAHIDARILVGNWRISRKFTAEYLANKVVYPRFRASKPDVSGL
jgi:hypothetical protein